MSLAFRVPGDPAGYTRVTQRGKFTLRARKYHCYMAAVQAEARRIGLRLPLEVTEASPLRIDTYATFRNRRHPDPENVRKCVVDALFYGGSGDKYVFGYHAAPRYAETPDEVGVVVIVGAEEILR
jgi:hypothetical protein